MIDKFTSWIEGTFTNRTQAYSYPTFFSYVRVVHKKIGDNLFYGEQQNLWREKPYRQFVMEVTQLDDLIITKTYKVDEEKHCHLKNLDDISMTYKENCDTIFTFDGTQFSGGIENCLCYVERDGELTYLKNSAILGEDYYRVYDQGFSASTNKKVWGSSRYYEFSRIDKEPLLISP